MSERIAVGIIRKSHGVRGEASVESYSDDPNRFDGLREVTLVSPDEKQTRTIAIESTRTNAGRALVKFAGIDSPEALKPLYNWTLELPETEALTLEENEYYLHDLVGLTLVDREGVERGVVTDAYEGGGGILLAVLAGEKTFELPFAADICVEIHLDEKKMIVELPEGIDDLDAVEE
ncbi:MAG TPA: ribosome maturation factor RimM [Thermoanaerobaculia bacterium]|jgi:16S rRNA processing protein RimM